MSSFEIFPIDRGKREEHNMSAARAMELEENSLLPGFSLSLRELFAELDRHG
jgi:hypothetical protein